MLWRQLDHFSTMVWCPETMDVVSTTISAAAAAIGQHVCNVTGELLTGFASEGVECHCGDVGDGIGAWADAVCDKGLDLHGALLIGVGVMLTVYYIFNVIAVAMKAFDVMIGWGILGAIVYGSAGAAVHAASFVLCAIAFEAAIHITGCLGPRLAALDFQLTPSETTHCIIVFYFVLLGCLMVAMFINTIVERMWAQLRVFIDPQELSVPTVDAKGQYAVVTGATCGLGLDVARMLVERGVHVITSSIDDDAVVEHAQDAVQQHIIDTFGSVDHDGAGSFTFVPGLNLADVTSVEAWADDVLHLLNAKADGKLGLFIANAGVIPAGGSFTSVKSTDDEEKEVKVDLAVAVNYIGHRVLYENLREVLAASGTVSSWVPRAVFVSSEGHRYSDNVTDDVLGAVLSVSGNQSYPRSKLLLQTYVATLRAEETERGIVVNCVHPGSMATPIYARPIPSFVLPIFDFCTERVLRTPYEGAFTVLHCALSKKAQDPNECKTGECPYYSAIRGNYIDRYNAHALTASPQAQANVEEATATFLRKYT